MVCFPAQQSERVELFTVDGKEIKLSAKEYTESLFVAWVRLIMLV